jgi:hypothetical protein
MTHNFYLNKGETNQGHLPQLVLVCMTLPDIYHDALRSIAIKTPRRKCCMALSGNRCQSPFRDWLYGR